MYGVRCRVKGVGCRVCGVGCSVHTWLPSYARKFSCAAHLPSQHTYAYNTYTRYTTYIRAIQYTYALYNIYNCYTIYTTQIKDICADAHTPGSILTGLVLSQSALRQSQGCTWLPSYARKLSCGAHLPNSRRLFWTTGYEPFDIHAPIHWAISGYVTTCQTRAA